jgi:MFS family permease
MAALATGWLYDRAGRVALTAVPVLSALVPVLAFTTTPAVAVTGVLMWGAVLGIQESTMRAAVADLVPTKRRGTAYGIFAAASGAATLTGGALAGVLYDRSISALIGTVVVIQLVALLILATTRATRRRDGP